MASGRKLRPCSPSIIVIPGGLPPRRCANAIAAATPAKLIGLQILLANIDCEFANSPSEPVGPLLTPVNCKCAR